MESRIVYSDGFLNQFGMISIRDFETEDQPTAETGEEEVISLPGNLFVATRTDMQGEVQVEIHVGECVDLDARLIFDGSMTFRSSWLCITGVVDPDEETLRLPRSGEWKIKVLVQGSPRPSRVMVFLDSREWLTAGGVLLG
ncbi:hypothetical protein [Streptomyces griseiscabiei]|uniref:Uncharacterized protein n=2 Tax=Streptomyces griseiscabiei TaxID=2993540 RepID=A0ABU4LCZ0_9ACTN|nr:hypothetical protein [Streptomyces griseiscabiei]MBZ3907540.1 hypothetical protein [Streptomyces griseiscabiei]MDX2913632.1 hypothetical protein [Streptomyces griseiscabiei]